MTTFYGRGRGYYRMDNVDRFNEVCAFVFGRCYASFPEPVDIEWVELAGDGTEARQEDVAFCQATVEWLQDAGYLWIRSMNSESTGEMRLSPKGLEALKVIPEGLEGRQSVGGRLADAAQKGVRDTARTLVATALTTAFRSFAMGGGY